MTHTEPSRRPLAVTTAVAAGSLGLLALAVAQGWLGADVDRGANFCEVSDGPLAQPVNTLSNLGFVVAGLAIAARAGRPGGLGDSTMARRPALATAMACLVVLLGPASMAMHATESEAGGHLDMLSMYLVAAFAVSYAAMRLLRAGPALMAAVFVAVVAACEVAGLWSDPVPVVNYAGNLAFGLALLLAVLLERRVTRTTGLVVDGRWLLAAVGALALGFAVWNTATTGAPLCFPRSVYQGHGVWHVLCAVAAWCLFRCYVSERPRTSDDTAAGAGTSATAPPAPR